MTASSPILTPVCSRALLQAAPALLTAAWDMRTNGGDPRKVVYVAETPLMQHREGPSSLSALLLAAADDVADRGGDQTDTEGGAVIRPEQEGVRQALIGQASLALDMGIPIWSDSEVILDRATRWMGHEAIQRPGLAGPLWATAQSPRGLPSGRASVGFVHWSEKITERPGVNEFVADLVAALSDQHRAELQARVRAALTSYLPSFYMKLSLEGGLGATDHLIHLADLTRANASGSWDLSSEQVMKLVGLLRDSVERPHLVDPLQISADLSKRWHFTISRLSDDAAVRLLVGVASLLPMEKVPQVDRESMGRPHRINRAHFEGPTLMLDMMLNALASRPWDSPALVLRSSPADPGILMISVLRHMGVPTAPPAARFIRAIVERSLLDPAHPLSSSGDRDKPNRRL